MVNQSLLKIRHDAKEQRDGSNLCIISSRFATEIYLCKAQTAPKRSSMLMQICCEGLKRRREVNNERKGSQHKSHPPAPLMPLTVLRPNYTITTPTLHLLDVIGGNALRGSTALNVCPPITTIAGNQHKSIAFRHGPFRVTPSLIVI